MKAYKVISRGREYRTCIVDSYGLFHTTLEEFKKTYGLHRLDTRDNFRYLRGLTNSRMSLFKDKTRLNLHCNPMTDDLALVFTEWITQKPGFEAIPADKIQEIPVEPFEFPF